MNLDDILNEKIKKVHGKWALVSKSDPDKVLQYYHGKDHPSKEWEKKVERRVHAFSEAESSSQFNVPKELESTRMKITVKDPFDPTYLEHMQQSPYAPLYRFLLNHLAEKESKWISLFPNSESANNDLIKAVSITIKNNLLSTKEYIRIVKDVNFLKELASQTMSLMKSPEYYWNDFIENDWGGNADMFEAESLDKTVDRMRNLNIDDIEHLKRYSNPQLKDWLKRLTAANKNNIGSALNTLDTMGPIAKPFTKSFVQKQFPGIDDTEFDQAWKFWQETDPATRSAVTKGDLTTLDPRDEHGFIKEADDYDAWLEKAKKRAEKQAAKKRAELQQVTKGIETDPEKLELKRTIQAARGELSKRKREALEKMEKLAQVYSKFSDAELDKIIGRYSKGPGAGSDFVEWLKSIKQEREDERYGIQQRKDLFKSVAGTMQGNQSQRAAPTQDAPWTQLGLTRKEFRNILNNPQHPRHREIKKLYTTYKQIDEDLTRRDFLKGVAGGALTLGAMNTAKALGLKDPTKTDEPDEKYARFTGTNPSPLHASPRLDLNNKYNRVGVNQRGNQFSVVLTKKHGLYLYFVTTDFAKDPYVYIELKGGEKYKFRKRTLNNNTFTIEDDRIAATLLNYEGPFNVYVDNDVYTFNILSSPDAQKLYRWWKEGKHEGL